jgi:alpha-N-arabinofuranosidase
MVNRSMDAPTTVTIDVSHLGDVSIAETHTLADEDIYAKNTLDDQERVALHPNETASIARGSLTITLPAVSWTAIALA